jgi:hypothetical protein
MGPGRAVAARWPLAPEGEAWRAGRAGEGHDELVEQRRWRSRFVARPLDVIGDDLSRVRCRRHSCSARDRRGGGLIPLGDGGAEKVARQVPQPL